MMTKTYRGLLIGLTTLFMVNGWVLAALAQTGAAANPEVVKWAYMSAAIAAARVAQAVVGHDLPSALLRAGDRILS